MMRILCPNRKSKKWIKFCQLPDKKARIDFLLTGKLEVVEWLDTNTDNIFYRPHIHGWEISDNGKSLRKFTKPETALKEGERLLNKLKSDLKALEKEDIKVYKKA